MLANQIMGDMDLEASGKLSKSQFAKAVRQLGLDLSDQEMSALATRYGDPDGTYVLYREFVPFVDAVVSRYDKVKDLLGRVRHAVELYVCFMVSPWPPVIHAMALVHLCRLAMAQVHPSNGCGRACATWRHDRRCRRHDAALQVQVLQIKCPAACVRGVGSRWHWQRGLREVREGAAPVGCAPGCVGNAAAGRGTGLGQRSPGGVHGVCAADASRGRRSCAPSPRCGRSWSGVQAPSRWCVLLLCCASGRVPGADVP